jgi:acyl-CoA synthetase (AMP-forming)/AMP-acid ligase II
MGLLVHEFINSAVQRFATAIALIDDAGSITYEQLWERSRRLAGALTSLGVTPGDRVAALMTNRNEWVETDLATSMAGGIRGRLNARDGEREYAWTINDLEPKVIVTGPEFATTIETLRADGRIKPLEILVLGPRGTYEQHLAAASPAKPRCFADSEPYLIYHTSGTTGNYKGAVYSHRAWVNAYRNMLALLMDDVNSTSKFMHVGPVSHQSGLLIGPALFRGAQSVMATQTDPTEVLNLIETQRITHTILAPTIINSLVSHPARATRDLTSLRKILYSGSPIAPAALRRAMDAFGPIFLQGYGSTEGGTIYNVVMYPDEHAAALADFPSRLASCGRPVPFFDVKIADDQGTPLPPGEIGEIWVRGDAVSQGYWRQPEATAAAYVDGWFKMGDLAVQDPAGYITISDRKSDMIISGGLNVYPREVEDVISAHPAVAEVAVIGIPHERWGEAVTACVTLVPGGQLTLDQIQAHCASNGLASYKKPLALDVLVEIPKTAVGKLSRRALREPYWREQSRRVG